MEQNTESKPLLPSPDILEVIDFCRQRHLDAERVGGWVWVEFGQKPPRPLRQELRQMGFVWSSRRGKWAHNCGKPSKSAHDSTPWDTYEHTIVSRSNG
jgi:hypothetical protein